MKKNKVGIGAILVWTNNKVSHKTIKLDTKQ